MKLIKWKIRADNRYIHLLAVLIIIFVLSPYITEFHLHFPVISLIFLLAIIFILRTLELDKKVYYILVTIGALVFLTELLTTTCTTVACVQGLSFISWSIYAVFLAISIYIMAYKMFSSSKITGDTIMGGISVYLLIGYLWTIFYYLIYTFDKNAFSFSNRISHTYLFYFSFTTLTTLGYGDAYPINKLAMVLTSLEAVTGQVYLAVFVARLVGLHVIKHSAQK